MRNITVVETQFTKHPQIAKHPHLSLLVERYTQELAAGYDPDTSLLTDMFAVLSELVVDDPALAADINVLEIAIVEEVFVRDPNLGSNPELSTMLSVYRDALEGGYEPPEETTDAILAALSGIETTDPVLSGLIGSVISELTPVPDVPETFGFVLNGIDASDLSGASVSSAGDVNGDGIADILIGAERADPDGVSSAGETYVVFGSEAGFSASLDLETLDGSNGFVLNGIDAGDVSGISVSSAGDVNGDGIDDIIIGAYAADPGGVSAAGETYVVFGKDTATAGNFAASLDLETLDGTNGFVLNGIDATDLSGTSVSSAGDVNGDGIADILIGAPSAAPAGVRSGETYVVFGKDQVTAGDFAASLDLEMLDGTDGFVLNGIDAEDRSGGSVSSAGDVNGDGIDDILIGASFADPDGVRNAGETYVVFGSDTGFSGLDLETLDGTDGFVLRGIDAEDHSGISVSSAGDVNGDEIDDILVGAYRADPEGVSGAGETYVVFGKDTATAGDFAASLDLEMLDGTDGFVLKGIDAEDRSGVSVSSAGDVNGDGIDDILIGAWDGVDMAGETYMVFGKDAATSGDFAASLDLEMLDGTDGFVFNGIDAGDVSGISVSSAGDVNGDGIDDIIIGAAFADPDGVSRAGESYVIYGGEDVLSRFDYADGISDGSINLALIGLNPADYDFLA